MSEAWDRLVAGKTPQCEQMRAAAPVETRDRKLLATLVYEAMRFSIWAAGQGLMAQEGEPTRDPEDFLFEYSQALDIDDWEGLAEVARDALLETISRSSADTAFEAYRETVKKVAAAREKGYAAALENLKEAWSALAMIRETIETLAPSGSVKAAEHLDGPTFTHEAEALVAGIQAISAVPQRGQDTITGVDLSRYELVYAREADEGLAYATYRLIGHKPTLATDDQIKQTIDSLIKTNGSRVERVREHEPSIGWFVGQTMKAFAGRADPERVLACCKEAIFSPSLTRPQQSGTVEKK